MKNSFIMINWNNAIKNDFKDKENLVTIEK